MEEVCGLKNIVISVGNGLLCDAIAGALRRSGQCRCQSVPGCRVALLCDEVADPELAQQVTQARQLGRIDGFLYASVTEAYLTAALEAL